MRYKARRWIHFWLDNHVPYWAWWVDEYGNRLACLTLGHVPIADQCGKPDHDFCAYCSKSLPGKARS